MDIAVVLNSSAVPVVGQSDMVMRGMAQDLDHMLAVVASGLISIERGADPQQLSRLLAGMRHAIRNAASMSDDIAELSAGPVVTPERVSLAVRRMSFAGVLKILKQLEDIVIADCQPITVTDGEGEACALQEARHIQRIGEG